MDWQILMSFTVVIFAVAGFFFLAQTLWSIWQMNGWMGGSSKTRNEMEPLGDGPSKDWEDNACYRECMDHPFSGIGNQYVHCAAECGLR
ncbi:MAG: hypothetical protein M0T73_06780 [Deltaproteobacteria bacterium]|nr:hypothetical protein [Deltaproteobacteria bacterium]